MIPPLVGPVVAWWGGGGEQMIYSSNGVTLHCGDSLAFMAEAVERVDHIITDPPYEATLHDSKNKLRERIRNDSGPELQGLNFAPIDGIRHDTIRLSFPICDGWFLAFCTVEGVKEWADAINVSPMKYKRACSWIKPDSTPQLNGQCPAQGFECFVTAWCGSGHSRWNSGGKRGVYTHNTNNRDRHGVHPTEKPVSLMREILLDFTQPGDLVFDPFMGSGTTGVACVQIGRRFLGIELNPDYYAIAVERISAAQAQGRLFEDAPSKKALKGLQVAVEFA